MPSISRPGDVQELHPDPAHFLHPVRHPGPNHRLDVSDDQAIQHRQRQQVPHRQPQERRHLRDQTLGRLRPETAAQEGDLPYAGGWYRHHAHAVRYTVSAGEESQEVVSDYKLNPIGFSVLFIRIIFSSQFARLLLFNKTEEDIPFREQFINFAEIDDR